LSGDGDDAAQHNMLTSTSATALRAEGESGTRQRRGVVHAGSPSGEMVEAAGVETKIGSFLNLLMARDF
jgi:hypothetical protein